MNTSKTHALYRFYDKAGALLYIGITNDPGRRLQRHRDDKPWWHEVTRIELEQHPTRAAALAAERIAIAKEQPRHNIRLTKTGGPAPPALVAQDDDLDGLVGRHFHSWREPREEEDTRGLTIKRGLVLEWQGHVLDRVETGLYLIELYSWWDGYPTGQQLIPVASMTNWTFYDDAVEMQVALGCREVDRGEDTPCGGEISYVVHNIIGPQFLCSHHVDYYAGDRQRLVWVNGKPKLP